MCLPCRGVYAGRGKNPRFFYAKATPDPESHLDAGQYFCELLVLAGTDLLCSCVQSTETFGRSSGVFYVKVSSDPEDEVLALFAHGNLDIMSTCTSYDGWDGLFAAFSGIFRTPRRS